MSEIVQFEIYADDIDRAKKFYENFFPGKCIRKENLIISG